MCQRHAVRINTFVWSGLTKSVFSCIFQVAISFKQFQIAVPWDPGIQQLFLGTAFFFPPSQRLADHNMALTAGDERLALESLEVEADCRSKSTWHETPVGRDLLHICSMVLVDLPTKSYKTGDFVRANVGKYSSTMEHMAYGLHIWPDQTDRHRSTISYEKNGGNMCSCLL